jgi:hypothetical protein
MGDRSVSLCQRARALTGPPSSSVKAEEHGAPGLVSWLSTRTGKGRSLAQSQNEASRIAPAVDVEKQERNFNTKGTKRTKKKEISA